MAPLESILIQSARMALEPFRAVLRGHQCRIGRAPLAVMYYHRIADTHLNPWSLSTHSFQQQIEWMTRNFEIISIDEVQRRLRAGSNSRPAVAITFDDGYAENCDFAIPFLLERGIPFTYYVSLDFIQTGRPFPHDLEWGEPLPINSAETIRAMAEAGVEIGGHTRHHPDLGTIHDRERLTDEIVTACRELGELAGQPVRHFAFPFGNPGNLHAAAVEIARAAGLASVASAWNGINLPGDDPFHIARIHGDPCLARVQNWLSGDRRLIRRRREIDRVMGLPVGNPDQ